jgi:hypothetical protein
VKPETPRKRRRAGLNRIADLLDQLRDLGELSEPRPAEFELESRPFVHFHYQADGTIVADVRLSKRRFIPFEVSEQAGQQEVLAAIERHLESRPGGRRAR